jgi:type IV pilus assembly protein PilP
MSAHKSLVPLLAAAALLAACGGEEQQELRAELAAMTKDMRGRVDPLPVVKPYEPVPYTAFEMPDPFGPAKIVLATAGEKSASSNSLAPDLDRPKEPLESYPLESLKMVGSLSQKKQTFAVVRADAGLYRVRLGNYLGQNFGVITRITDGEITLRELIQDAAGDWTERTSTLMLQETGGTK